MNGRLLSLTNAGARFLLLVLAACARPGPPATTNPPNAGDGDSSAVETPDLTTAAPREDPAVQPRVAMLAGLMPRSSIAADQFLAQHPDADGRGVVIGVLDSGIDAGLPGFQQTTTGDPKVMDLRDFSGEGHIELRPVEPSDDGTITVGGVTLGGFGAVAARASAPYYGGVFRELPLGGPDINDNRRLDDTFPLIVARTASGWAVFTDTDNDQLLDDETPIHDYLVAQETFTFSKDEGKHHEGPMTIAANFSGTEGRPVLDLFFDNQGHGTHVAGIAAGHNMFGIEGFDGIAPGAKLIGVKIANNLRGGITVTGSMLRAMNYAADFAQQRGLPLILNMSFGVGNEVEGGAAIDSLVNEFVLKHPDVLFVISAGNEGPGVSTIGFPGSAERVMSVCALFPGVFTGPRPQGFATDADGIASFSSRGGELGKPDVCAPGLAFSNVPLWNSGGEISGGTSMAAPQVSGAAALLQSAMVAKGRPARGIDLRQALIASADRARGGTALDLGAGVPRVTGAYDWLSAGHQAGMYSIRALPDGGNTSTLDGAYRRSGLESAADTIQRFEITSVAGQPAARLLLRSDEPWLKTPRSVELRGGPATVELRYDARRLRTPGLYVGSVWAIPASDTLAGPAFRLTNTIVVPQPLDQPVVEGRDLGPGRWRRYFFHIDETMGGFTVELELRYATQSGTLYLFEPNGQQLRGEGSRQVGSGQGSKVRITVPADEVIPGVYEVVVTAPATSALSYELRVARPRYVIREIGDGPTAVVGLREDAPSFLQDASVFQRTGEFPVFSDSVQILGQFVGAVRDYVVSGLRDEPQRIPVTVPAWANEIVVDVQLDPETFNQMTDLGVTLFDSLGVNVAEGPLSYAFGRMTAEIERFRRGTTLELEIFPAFAHLEPPSQWEAEVRIGFMAATPIELKLADVDTSQVLTMDPGRFLVLQFEPAAPEWVLTDGFHPLVEIRTNPAAGPPAVRRRVLRSAN